jgi:hypothetical protein
MNHADGGAAEIKKSPRRSILRDLALSPWGASRRASGLIRRKPHPVH